MLHKSFKSGKCKTSLKLAVARIKLLKNKRDAQVKHLRRELAQLVESGQEKTARIRVEHVVREEKTMAAYDLLEIYCELIVARLPIIESQKNCPIDLKEAIASVIFAAPRCADIPELLDVRKHFTAKYGKEFVTSALELRPECGVGRMMVEKLSANAPNGETKMKILAAIAQEHNINWDPASLEDKDSKPTNDFLNGPSTFETASKTTFKHPDAQLPPDPGRKYESSTDLPDHRANIPPLGSHFSASTETSASTRVTTAFSPEPRASESRMGQQEYRHSSSRDENILNKHNWNLEFKDATAAAQAAAESAERASMAARAAVELSSHENNMRQYPTDSGFRNEEPRTSGQKYQEFVTKDSVEVVSGAPGSSTEIRNPRMQNQSKDRKETFPGAAENRIGGKTSVKRRPDKSISSESNVASIDNETPVVSSQKADRYYEKRSSPMESISPSLQSGNPEKAGSVDVESRKQQSSQSEVESLYRQPQDERSDYADNYGDGRTRKEFSRSSSSSVDGDHDDFTSNMNPVESLRRRSSQSEEESFYRQPQKKTSDYTDNHGDGRSRKQSSRYSSSHTSADGDHHDVISTVHPNEYFLGVDDNSLFSNDRGNKQVGDEQSVFFDESGSDEDYTADFAAKDNEHGSSLYFPSPVRESPQYLSTDSNTWNPIVNRGKSVEKQPSSEKHFVTEVKPPFKSLEHQAESEAPSQSNDLAPLAFDDSDGLSSESENDDLLVSGKTGSGSGLHNSFPRSPSSPKNDKNHSLPVYSIKNEGTSTTRKVIVQSYSDDLKFEEVQLGRNQDLKQNAVGDSSEKYGFSDTLTHQPFSGQRKSMRSDDSRQESFHQPEIDEQPLQTSKFTSAKQLKVEENPSTLESDYSSNSESEQGFNFTKFKGGFRNKGFQHPPYSRAPLGGTSLPSQNQSTVDSPYSQKMHVKAQKESSSATSKSVFDSDSDDSYEKLPRQAIGGHRHRDGKHDDAHKESPSRTVGRRNHLNGRHDDDHEESAHSTVFRRSSQDGRHGDDHEESPRQAVGRRSSMDGKHDDAHEESPRQNVGRRSSMDGKRDDAHEDSPNRTVGRRSYVDGKLSRRTKDFLRQSGTSTSEVVVTPDAGMGRNTSRSSATEPHWKRQSEPMRSGSAEDPMLSATTAPVQQKPPAAESKPAVYRETSKFAPPSSAVDQSEPHRKPQSEPMRSGSAEDSMLSATTASVQQKPPKPAAESKPAVYRETSKFAPPSSAVDQSSNVSTALPKTASSGSSESSNTSSTSDASKSKNNPLKKDSHVHPNLPDYDTLAAHFHSLRANRR